MTDPICLLFNRNRICLPSLQSGSLPPLCPGEKHEVKTCPYVPCVSAYTYILLLWRLCYLSLSHNNPCFPCKKAITNFIVSHTCKIMFYDIIDRTVHMFTLWRHPKQNFPNMAKWVCFWTLFFKLIRWIQLCNKRIWHSLTVEIRFY